MNPNISSILHNEYGILIQDFNSEEKILKLQDILDVYIIFLEPKYSIHFTYTVLSLFIFIN